MDIQVTYITVNRRGQPQRDQQRVAGPTVILGRGTQCQIHLPDPRIALQHAEITVGESEATIKADAGRIQVNGRSVDGAKLTVGDSVEVGPYLLEVEAPPAGVPLAVSVKLVVPLASFGGDGRRFQLQAPRLSKRRLSYIAALGTLLICLLAPIAPDMLGYSTLQPATATRDTTEHMVRTVSDRLVQTWNPGPVSQAHQPFGTDCRKCHQFPFVQVRDLSCVACHKSIKEHVPVASLTGPKGHAFQDIRCAECHRDHKGQQMAPRAQDECAVCHRDVKVYTADPKTGNATDFYSDHPQFQLALLDADKPDAVRRVRQAQPAPPEMVERSNLKFSHKVHLDPRGVRDPAGRQDAKAKARAEDTRTVMICADCHEPNEGGRLILPVSFEDHCQRCHSLSFEPGAPRRQAAHGDVEKVATMLREFYARLVLGDVPAGVTPPRDLPRMRPGAVLTSGERRASLQAADQKANQALNELFTEQPEKPREVCIKCHQVSRKAGGAGWDVAPVRFARVWMPESLFSHAKHATEDCVKCHDVKRSGKASDIAMPDIAVCRQCHVGARPVEGKVTSDCSLCHKFHAGKNFWHEELQAQLQPRGKK